MSNAKVPMRLIKAALKIKKSAKKVVGKIRASLKRKINTMKVAKKISIVFGKIKAGLKGVKKDNILRKAI